MSDLRLPWAVRPHCHDDWGWIRDADGDIAAQAKNSKIGSDKFDEYRRDGMDPYEERANFIVKAVNNHDALVDALRDLVFAVEAEVNEKGGGGFILARLDDARRALELVGTPRGQT